MTEGRTVVITGASRGLGLASAARLHRAGWTVVAAMRSVHAGLENLRAATGAGEDDPRLIPVALDLTDPASVDNAVTSILEAVDAPFGLVHNAGISAAGTIEETPLDVWERMFATHVRGPIALTKGLLPAMRTVGRGRIIVVCSASGIRGMPATAPYSTFKGAQERWAESLAGEVNPFGIGVSILVTGTYDTAIITDAGTTDTRELNGPYARHHASMDKRGRAAMKAAAKSPDRFADALAKALDSTAPFVHRSVGVDARMLRLANRYLPAAAMHRAIQTMMGIPRFGGLRK